MDTPDPETVVLHFAEPDVLAMDSVADLDRGAGDFGNSTKAMGTGPFELAEWQPGTRMLLKRSKHYWKEGLPYLDAVDLQVLPDPQSEVANLQAGAEDLITLVPLTSFDAVKADPGFRRPQPAPTCMRSVSTGVSPIERQARPAAESQHGPEPLRPGLPARCCATHVRPVATGFTCLQCSSGEVVRVRHGEGQETAGGGGTLRRASHFLSRSRRKLRRIS